MSTERKKLHTLDAFRGIVALIVVVFHGDRIFPHPQHGYLAVDLFFGLSGFVISLAYQHRLDEGLSLREFLTTRFIRLAPLYYLALVFATVVSLASKGLGSFRNGGWHAYPLSFFLAMFLLPSSYKRTMFPLNGPFWSLFLEVWINIAHGLFWRRMSTYTLGLMVALFACLLTWSVLYYGSQDRGFVLATLVQSGLPRVLFSYCMGMLLYRMWRTGFRIAVSPSLLIVALGLILFVPTPHEAIVALLLTLFAFPVMIYLGACSEPASHNKWWITRLGLASYAIYLIHLPALRVIRGVMRPDPNQHSIPILCFTLVTVTSSALLLDKYYDAPMRRWLASRLRPSKNVAQPPAS